MNEIVTADAASSVDKWNTPTIQFAGGFQLVPQTLKESVEIAKLMAKAGCAVPKYLHGNTGAALAVAMQAWRWNMDPFAVASKTYMVVSKHGEERIAYEAQLIAAVVNTRAGLKDRPNLKYEGEGRTRKCTVTLVFLTGAVREYESPEIGNIKTQKSPLWQSEPDQQLAYYSIRAAARRWCPEVILGVYDRDELEEAVSLSSFNRRPAISDRLAEATQQPQEGFGATDVDQEAKALEAPRDEDVTPTVNQTGPLEDPDIPECLDRREPKPEPDTVVDDVFPSDRPFDPERDEIYEGSK